MSTEPEKPPTLLEKQAQRLAEKEALEAKANGKNGYTLVNAKDVIIRPKQWVWEGHLLRSALELLTGIPGLGKSQVQIGYVACVTAGLKWPDGAAPIPPANVIMLTAEDALDQEVVPRLVAAGAVLERVFILKSVRQGGNNRQFLLGEDLDKLEKVVALVGDVGLITVDPITAYMGGRMDSHKSTEVRSQLGPLKDFAERLNIATSAITHPPKSAGQKAIDHFIGSQAFIAAGRIGHVCIEEMQEDDDDNKTPTGRILFANAKNNTHVKMATLAYRVVAVPINQDPDTRNVITAPRVQWEAEPVDITADQAVAAALSFGKKKQEPRGDQAKVQAFLSEILMGGQPVPQKHIEAEAAKRGFSSHQLRTAREKLHIRPKKTAREWTWADPDQGLI
jgi:putative DNA primase/helicase